MMNISMHNHSSIPNSTDQKGQNLYLFSDQNGAKTLPFAAARNYMAYIREYPPSQLTNPRVYRQDHDLGS